MPEGDSVYLAAARLHAALAGQQLTKTDFRVPAYATLDLSDRAMTEVVPRGKHILMRVGGDTTIHTHLKMEGGWHLYRPGEKWRRAGWHARLVLATEPWTAVGFRLGVVDVLPTPEEERVVGHLGPDLLGDDWDAEVALANLTERAALTIGAALLDQTALAGLGNIYKSEVCFLSGLDPWTPVAEVPDLRAVIDVAKRLIEANRTTGMQITTGDNRPGRRQWVYGRKGEPCRRCGTSIQRRGTGERGGSERVTYWCPSCQPRR